MRKEKVSAQQMIDIYEKHKGSHSAIAEELGLSRERVRQVLSPLGYEATNLNRKVEKIEKEIKALFDKGLKAKDIAKELKRSEISTRKAMHKMGILQKSQGPEKKYSDELLIKSYGTCDGNYSKIGKELGIHPCHVQKMFKTRGLIKDYPSKFSKKAKVVEAEAQPA